MHHQLQLLLNIILEAGRPIHTFNVHQMWSVHDDVLKTIYELFVTQAFSLGRPVLPLCALFSTSGSPVLAVRNSLSLESSCDSIGYCPVLRHRALCILLGRDTMRSSRPEKLARIRKKRKPWSPCLPSEHWASVGCRCW